ncbi:MAG TPA: hypothetical protein VKZ50_08300 [bacterium]|nr:hypothetical protein [bacterium]
MVARLGTALVLGLFGYWELTGPSQWTGYVPQAIASYASPVALVLLHGWVLFVLSVAALIDLMPSIVSWIAVAMMTEVVAGLLLTSGDTSILVRDVGVLTLALAWALDCRPTTPGDHDLVGKQRSPVASR